MLIFYMPCVMCHMSCFKCTKFWEQRSKRSYLSATLTWLSSHLYIFVSLLLVSVFESLKAQKMWRRRTIFQTVDVSRDTTLSNWISLCAQIVAPIQNNLKYLYFPFSHVTCQVSPVICHVFWEAALPATVIITSSDFFKFALGNNIWVTKGS